MKKILLLLFILCAQKTFPCSCVVIENFQTKDDLSAYDYIALVKITALPAVHPGWGGSRSTGNINVTTVEQFKGDATSLIFDTAYRSNCRLGVNVGDQWLIFGSEKEGKTLTESCSYTVFYKGRTGERDWATGFKRLDKLRRIYNPEQIVPQRDVIKYPEGNTEIVQHFKNGKLDGLRTIYYPNGSVYLKEDFNEGKRKSFQRVYYQSGSLASNIRYKHGYITQKVVYYDTAELKRFIAFNPDIMRRDNKINNRQKIDSALKVKIANLKITEFWKEPVMYKYVYRKNGAVYESATYDRHGTLTSRTFFDAGKRLINHTRYQDSKLVAESVTDGNTNTYVEIDHSKGEPIKRTFPCDNCDAVFNAENAKPDEILVPYD